MKPDSADMLGIVKASGQLAQLTSFARRLGAASFLCGAAATLLVIGYPQTALACLREAIR